MLKSVIFDVDGTLYDYQAAHAAAWPALEQYAEEALSLAPKRFGALHDRAFELQKARSGANSAAIHNRLIRYQLVLEMAGLPVRHASKMAQIYWSAFLGAIRPFDGAKETLRRLKDMGLSVGIGTNMTAYVQYLKLEKLGLLDDVDFMVTSEEASAEKPDPRLFALCAEKAGCPAAECAFVGDHLCGDALGALAAGMRAFWLCPSPDENKPLPGVIRLRALAELPDRIDSIQPEGA